MGPFDLPPSTPPVSFDPPSQNSPGRRSTGRTAAVAAACVALIAAGVLAVAQFASSNEVDVANAAQEGGTTPPTPPTAPEPTTPPEPTLPADSQAPDDQVPDDATDLDGKIVIDIGDGDPIVIDLGDLGSLAGGNGDLGKIEQCIGDLPFDLNIDGGPGLNVFGSGDQITVTGPNGLTVLDFGEGDGSVTITKKDGEITISSEGDVQENDLSAPDFSEPLPSLPDFDQIYQCLEDATG